MEAPTGRASKRLGPLIGALMALALASPAVAQTCARPDDEVALQVRVLQTNLMVGALSCQQHDPYNAFVARFQPTLAVHGKALKAYFKRAHGGGWNTVLDEFVTRLANEASLRGMQNLSTFCTESKRLFHAVMAADATAGLEGFVATWSRRGEHGVLPCVQQAAIP
ncbi:MAG: hypothetical protein ACREER_13675 [Alphaproteobacteria bacterium]